jgi:uncharacterized protein YecT (DUF1311 family)
MRAIGKLVAILLVSCVTAAAQDIAGVEDCTKTSGLDRRTGCLQANVNFLQRALNRNALDANRRLQMADTQIAALQAAVADLRKRLDEVQAARKADDKKSEGKQK